MFNFPKRRDDAGANASTVEAFIEAARRTPAQPRPHDSRARLIFALDATMSRQPTWAMATELQGRMFETAAALGGLDVQLVYFRGFSECRASPFVGDAARLAGYMRRLRVQGGRTQIGRVLRHAVDEAARAPVGAVVYIGDALEEQADPLCQQAGQLALFGTKLFLFQEGRDRAVEAAFRELARITGGAYASFDASAPDVLAALLAAAAAYAAGGREAVARLAGTSRDAAARALLAQIG